MAQSALAMDASTTIYGSEVSVLPFTKFCYYLPKSSGRPHRVAPTSCCVHTVRIAVFCCIFTLLSGCNAAPTTLPLVACGVDYADGQYTLTLEGVHQNSLESQAQSVFLTTTADDLAQAFALATRQSAAVLSFDHMEVLVVAGVLDATAWADTLAFFCAAAPPSALLTATSDCTAAAILSAEGYAEPLTGLALSQLLAAQTHAVCLYQAPDIALPTALPAVTLTADNHVRLAPQEDAHAQ